MQMLIRDDRLGSFASFPKYGEHVGFTPDSRHGIRHRFDREGANRRHRPFRGLRNRTRLLAPVRIGLLPRRDCMKLPRRGFLRLAAGAAAPPALSLTARAQAYPSRPVRLIVGIVPGSGPDIVGRLLGQWLSDRLGRPFVIENRPGAGTNVA